MIFLTTLAEKLSGRTIDAVYCKTCDIVKGIYPLSLRTVNNISCPHCHELMTEPISITIYLHK